VADEDLLVHVHVPKCGGTSIRLWMAASFPEAHGDLYPQRGTYVFDEPRLLWLGIANPRLRSMSSHHVRTFPAELGERRMRYFTFLREPRSLFASYFRYRKQTHGVVDDPLVLAGLPPDFARCTSREYAEWLLDCPLDVPFRDSFQTNFFAGYVWRERTGRGPDPYDEAYPRWDDADWRRYRRERLELAKEALRGFLFVGVVERMEDGLPLLHERAAALGFALAPIAELPHENVTTGDGEDLHWLHDGDAVGRRFLRRMEEDDELYAFAQQLLGHGLREAAAKQRA
jgi:hypothetical protein